MLPSLSASDIGNSTSTASGNVATGGINFAPLPNGNPVVDAQPSGGVSIDSNTLIVLALAAGFIIFCLRK